MKDQRSARIIVLSMLIIAACGETDGSGSDTESTGGASGGIGAASGGAAGSAGAGSESGGAGGSGGGVAGGGDASGGTGGASGGSAGQGGTGGLAGSGGAVGGTAGQGGTAGAAGSGGAVVLDPPGPGIACGETTCAEGSEMCCVDESSRWCSTSVCSGVVARLECDDSADCPGQRCCYTNIFASVPIATLCTSDCASAGGIQVCKEPGDCANGEVCHAFACGFDTGNVTLGLCTATAPGPCE
jgi:hypothetical protein